MGRAVANGPALTHVVIGPVTVHVPEDPAGADALAGPETVAVNTTVVPSVVVEPVVFATVFVGVGFATVTVLEPC